MKKEKRTIIYALILCLIIIPGRLSAQRFSLSPTIRLGILITPPSLEELGYNPDIDYGDDFKTNPFNFGLGLQGLFGLGSTSSTRIGFDIGLKKVFTSTMTLDNTDVGLGYSENVDKEFAVILNLVYDKAFGEKFHFQAGAGPCFSVWTWTYDYTGPSATHNDDGGVSVNFGLMTAGSIDLFQSDNISIPLSLRLDCVFRYGVLISPVLSTGITF